MTENQYTYKKLRTSKFAAIISLRTSITQGEFFMTQAKILSLVGGISRDPLNRKLFAIKAHAHVGEKTTRYRRDAI
jgi:hypothetical protein